MRILLPYYSRSGHTEMLALALAAELRERGHDVIIEKIVVETERSKWRLALPLLSTLPVLPLYLWVPRFRDWWLAQFCDVLLAQSITHNGSHGFVGSPDYTA